MKLLLDTHVLIWILHGSRRLSSYPWLERYRPWGISPVSLLEIDFLAESGRLVVEREALVGALLRDRRFVVDEPPLLALVQHAADLSWTRDPFDRLIAAHSGYRRMPLCTADASILQHHRFLPRELRPDR